MKKRTAEVIDVPSDPIDVAVDELVAATESKDTNPKDRVATNRLALSLVPSSAIAYCALALTEGDFKYGGFNWRIAGVRASVYLDAVGRHIAKWADGENADPVTRVPHLANALACLAVLVDACEQGNLNDDRPPAQNVGALFTAAESIVKHLRETYAKEEVTRYTQAAIVAKRGAT